MSEKKDTFHFSYSAKQQEEIRRIREKYLPGEPDELEHLRQLDRSVTRKATAGALMVGILGTLVLGLGMCCCLVWAERLFAAGIIIGILGIAGVVAAYPLYGAITKREKTRLAPEILRLADKLSQS